ncbi:DUF2971 domain-containing protein [Arthrobacter bambusae]|uniref:DUF2971 domain-containing protein n=1 Tax=Arthrobacter bambusae TaxID=1338426 RepID=UPI001F507DB3|nr:DUF2971 domain-containing protein [Arthrobacter bambusae]MCI0140653.1 DUF2971 domain-containing protein [Arthrobacter bambusae]
MSENAQAEVCERVWHYTTREGLAGILESNVLWARAANQTNDPEELLVGPETLRELLDETSEDIDPQDVNDVLAMVGGITVNTRYGAHLLSGCRQPDSLAMWRLYAGNTTGYAIVLDAKQPLFIRRQRPLTPEMVQAWSPVDSFGQERIKDWAASTSQTPWSWEDVVYEPSDLETKLREGLLALEETARLRRLKKPLVRDELEIMADLGSLFRHVKHNHFEYEKEKRVVCMTMPGAEGPFVPVSFDGGPANYVELGIPLDPTAALKDGKAEPVDRLPIVEIFAGPNGDPDYAKSLLQAHRYQGIQVSRSSVQFRIERGDR